MLHFRKSSYSVNESACVEIADTPGACAVRDTMNRQQGHLEFPSAEWTAFLRTLDLDH
ncbi:DUF397 domain-containing protein [Nocardiopsis chromatogenes]|uniref:DUF397 domain-containing protein n=1 Tax=Nocardiopsis chromatogenes TaxID=280239 RepID=UPI00036C0244|nr:DUF397 domain-containing protein [Nocardiopsis chromatogenes]